MNFREYLNESNDLLCEMSTVCHKKDGFGFTAKMYSDDHNPPHVHIYDTENNELGKMIIGNKCPSNKNDIKFIKNYEIYDGKLLEKIYKWLTSKNEDNIENWSMTKTTWRNIHED